MQQQNDMRPADPTSISRKSNKSRKGLSLEQRTHKITKIGDSV